ncbi:MAG: hemerythrin domain-containing protein [Coriobacteriia bacterium]|nr:hemerythrin domain-containing protein [Coriobacteriia bacterium]
MRATRDPAGMLMMEHRLIERVVRDMSRTEERIRTARELSPAYVSTVADFMRTYADACHHGKEEDILFESLSGRALEPDHAKAMDRLVREHEWARGATTRLHEAGERYADGDTGVLGDIARGLRALAQFYPRHIHEKYGRVAEALEEAALVEAR